MARGSGGIEAFVVGEDGATTPSLRAHIDPVLADSFESGSAGAWSSISP